MKRILSLLLIACSLQGCIFVVGAAIGAAAAAGVYDHRTVEYTMRDVKTSNAIVEKIRANQAMRDNCHIEVTVFNGIVLLSGQTPSDAWRQQAEGYAQNTPNVDKVYNQLTIEGPTSSLTRASDSWITTKVRSLMLANQDLKSSSIKVVTENGVVYLMGIVSQNQANIAIDIARQVSGVQKVVKIFQYDNTLN
ncbi:MAG TPA: BON domain-containing protein [Gammaproteobacteria bacterium]|jgi:osmotically-inducible protein OsmY|nr:BON domain-containing protein [Gammaproteobacteria bacterium]